VTSEDEDGFVDGDDEDDEDNPFAWI
jgi:hypothetical protein